MIWIDGSVRARDRQQTKIMNGNQGVSGQGQNKVKHKLNGQVVQPRSLGGKATHRIQYTPIHAFPLNNAVPCALTYSLCACVV